MHGAYKPNMSSDATHTGENDLAFELAVLRAANQRNFEAT